MGSGINIGDDDDKFGGLNHSQSELEDDCRSRLERRLDNPNTSAIMNGLLMLDVLLVIIANQVEVYDLMRSQKVRCAMVDNPPHLAVQSQC